MFLRVSGFPGTRSSLLRVASLSRKPLSILFVRPSLHYSVLNARTSPDGGSNGTRGRPKSSSPRGRRKKARQLSDSASIPEKSAPASEGKILGGEAGSGWLLSSLPSDTPESATHQRRQTRAGRPQDTADNQAQPHYKQDQSCTAMIVSPAAPLVGLTDHPPTSNVKVPSTVNAGPPSEDQQLPLRTKAPLMALAASVQDSATAFVDMPTKSVSTSTSASSNPPTPPDAAATLSDLAAAAASYGVSDVDAALTSSQQEGQRLQQQPQRDGDLHAESGLHGWREALQVQVLASACPLLAHWFILHWLLFSNSTTYDQRFSANVLPMHFSLSITILQLFDRHLFAF